MVRAEADLDDILEPTKKPKGVDAWGKKERHKITAPPQPLYRCKHCPVRVLYADHVGHLRRCVGYGVKRADAILHFEEDGTYAHVISEFTP